jgi:hypothetical protein
MKKKRQYTAADPKRRARAVIIGLYAHLAAAAALAVFTAMSLFFLAGEDTAASVGQDYLPPAFEPYALPYGLAAILYVATLLIYLVLFLMWVHRTNRNAHVLEPSLEMSPAWAVGWFFVPFASLIKPFEGVDQTWRISTDPTRWKALDTPVLLRWWWGLFLAANLSGSLSDMVSKSHTVGGFAAGAGVGVVAFCLVIASCLVTARMVRQLTDRQVVALNTIAFS